MLKRTMKHPARWRSFATVLLVLASLGLGTERALPAEQPAASEPTWHISSERMATMGTYATAGVLGGRYAYLVDGSLVDVYDLSNAASPRVVGTVSFGFEELTSVHLGEPWLFVETPSRLFVVDVGTPERPRIVGQLALEQQELVEVVGSQVYFVTTGATGVLAVFAIDFAVPARPTEVLRFEAPYVEHVSPSLLVEGTTLYLGGLVYYDYSTIDPADPLDEPDVYSQLQSYDISDPANVHLLDTVSIPGGYSLLMPMATGDNILYIYTPAFIERYDVSDPSDLRPIAGKFHVDDFQFLDLHFERGLIFVADTYGVRILDARFSDDDQEPLLKVPTDTRLEGFDKQGNLMLTIEWNGSAHHAVLTQILAYDDRAIFLPGLVIAAE